MLKNGAGICFVSPFCSSIAGEPKHGHHTIYTLRFPGEEDTEVRDRLNDALARLSFRGFCDNVYFHSPDEMGDFMDELEVDEIVDSPGAPTISFRLSAKVIRGFFLPRDPHTHEFIDLDKQVRCLSILRVPHSVDA